MHTSKEAGIDADVTRDIEANFAWTPPLSAQPQDADDLLAGPETILPDDIAVAFVIMEGQEQLEGLEGIDDIEVLEGNAIDFDELDRINRDIVPQAAEDEVDIVDHDP
jgi:hypothetical protein